MANSFLGSLLMGNAKPGKANPDTDSDLDLKKMGTLNWELKTGNL
jgi:hypothetical protein